MPVPPIDITGQRFGALTVLSMVRNVGSDRGAKALCRCDCGKQVYVLSANLRRQNTRSCGCMRGPRDGKLGRERAVVIKSRIEAGSSRCDLAIEFGVSESAISRVVRAIAYPAQRRKPPRPKRTREELIAAKGELTRDWLRRELEYVPETGEFFRRNPRKMVGHVNKRGYVKVGLGNRQYPAHRLAWFYMTGEWPGIVDHRNGQKDDNRWDNLREVCPSGNAQNLRKATSKSSSGLLGAYWHEKQQKWISQIYVRGQVHYIGTFSNPYDAHQAYVQAKRKLHEACTI